MSIYIYIYINMHIFVLSTAMGWGPGADLRGMNVVGLAGEKIFFYNHSAAVGRQFSKREAPQIVADAVEKQRALGSPSNCHRNQWNVLEQNRILSLETCKQTMLVGSFFCTLVAASRREACTASIVAKKNRGIRTVANIWDACPNDAQNTLGRNLRSLDTIIEVFGMHKLGNFHTLVGQPSKPPQAWPNARRRFEAGRCPTSLSELSFSDKTGSHQRSVSATVPS